MFQTQARTMQPQTQEQQQQEKEKRETQARDAVAEGQQRMLNEAQLRSLELNRQGIDGSTKKVEETVRQGATAQQVAEEVKQRTVGSLDFDLGRLTPPSIAEDRRQEIRAAFLRAVDTQTSQIKAEEMQHAEKVETEKEKRSAAEQQQRAEGRSLSS